MIRYLRGFYAPLMMMALACYPCRATEDLLYAARVLYPYYRGSLVVTCGLCHTSQAGGGALNPYGKDVLAAGAQRSSLPQVDWRDSDGDGAMNIDELRVDSHPADRDDFPTPEELADVRATEWPLEMVTYPNLLIDVKQVRATSRLLSQRQEERVSAALGRPLTRYERRPFLVVARSAPRASMRDDLAGAVYVIDTRGPSGPLQVAVFLFPNRVVAGILIMRHNEGEAEAPVGSSAPDGTAEEAEGGVAPQPVLLPGGLVVRPPRPMAFTSEEALDSFKRWSLDNQAEWDETVRRLQEWDPGSREVYPVIAHAVETALWLAEETMPRPVFQGALGMPKRTVD